MRVFLLFLEMRLKMYDFAAKRRPPLRRIQYRNVPQRARRRTQEKAGREEYFCMR